MTAYCCVAYTLDNIRRRTRKNVFMDLPVLTETEKLNCVLERTEPPLSRMINKIYGRDLFLDYIGDDGGWVSLFFGVFILARNKHLCLLTGKDFGAHTQMLGCLRMQVEKQI